MGRTKKKGQRSGQKEQGERVKRARREAEDAQAGDGDDDVAMEPVSQENDAGLENEEDEELVENAQRPGVHPKAARAAAAAKRHASAAVVAAAEGAVEAVEERTAARSAVPPSAKHGRWTNRQRTLVFSSRGVSYKARHLMNDLRTLMPHSKKDSKLDRKDKLQDSIPELCELKNCNNVIYFEARKKLDLYMWIGKMPHGPTAKFLVENVHTMDELKMTGNCMKGSRPLLNFDESFDTEPHLQVYKELLFQTFGTPRHHPKSKAFVDRVLSFFWLDGRIWVRNYQVTWEDPTKENPETVLTEIGPRFVLNPVRLFGGSFGGATLFENPEYIAPNARRAAARAKAAVRYKNRTEAKIDRKEREKGFVLPKDEVADVFEDADISKKRKALDDSDDDDDDEVDA